MSEQETTSETTPATPVRSDSAHGETKTLGLQRWVQMAFTVFALLLFWVLDKVITIIWDRFAEPTPELVSLIAAVLATGTTLMLYRNPRVSRVAQEIVGELAKVSWPSRRETQVSTIVVIVTSLIAAMIVGAFDAAWSKLTDLIYKV